MLGVGELVERAMAAARRLLALGVSPGDPVGLLGPNRPEWVVSAFATWLAGAVAVPIQLPLRVRDPDAFGEQLRSLVAAGGCGLVLGDPALLDHLPTGVGVEWQEEAGGSSGDLPDVEPGMAAVIQFSSGSTAAPKGALLTHAAVMAQMEILGEGLRGEPSILSWTPFFHDLGLFYNIVQVVTWGLRSHHLPTERFARDPIEWLRLVKETGATYTVAPSSAFGSAVRAARARGERIDLSGLEAAYFAAEGVDPAAIRSMVESARDSFGFREEALGCTYGLAEAVMAVSYPAVGSGMRIERVGLDDLVGPGIAASADGGPSRLVVSSGPPRMDLRIAAPDGDLPERRVGEILVRGESLMSGYVGRGQSDPFEGGWLRTGDLGYLADGDLYVTGRIKDVVIAMGHNYYPEDFEWAAARVEGVHPGRCVAFNRAGAEEVVVLVEARKRHDRAQLSREVSRAISDAVGIPPDEVVVLPPGAIEKTTSGKLRRAVARERYATGALA